MPIIELSTIVEAIVGMGIEAAWEKTKRRETVLKLLKRFNFDPGDPPADFEGIYTYTLVEYGVFKPEPILNFFRNEFVREAFRQSFYKNDASILEREAESIIQWNEETTKLGKIDGDPRREFAAFSVIFHEIVDRVRTPAEVKQDQKLDQIYGDLHSRATEILEQLNQLPNLEEIRALVTGLKLQNEARRFVAVPTGDKLKVFISSKMAELRDVRELVNHELERHGIDAWIFEDAAGARPGNIIETSLQEVEAADIYIGLFWEKYGPVTIEEYRHARALNKPCFIYIRDRNLQRESELEKFLQAEIYDLQQGVTYDFFDSQIKLVEQVAADIMTWLVRTYRELSAQAQQAIGTRTEIEQLEAEVERLRAASKNPLPQGDLTDILARYLREWFAAVGYGLERNVERSGDHADLVITVPRRRRGVDRILVKALGHRIELADLDEILPSIEGGNFDEIWLVTERRISQLARTEADHGKYKGVFVYTLDELLDEQIDWEPYFKWLEQEVKQKRVDEWYVPLSGQVDEYNHVGQKRGTNYYSNVDHYINQWLDSNEKAHISILGEFGTGKTWFCLHYAWNNLQRYRRAKEQGINRPRLSLVIPLRDYAKALKVESVLADFFFNKHSIRLTGAVFEQLNRMGKLLLIFDGFDEMAARVDRQKVINNFWELARVVVPGAKAILTCRTEHFPNAQESRKLLSAELQASTANLSGQPPQFEVLELTKFTDDQIRQVLSHQVGLATVEQVMAIPELLDLVRRPIMTELVLDALPDIETGKPVNLTRVYLYAVRRKMERDIKAERTFTSFADKLYFLCELSWEMYSTDQMSLNYREFPNRIRHLFGPTVKEQKDLDHWHYDLMGQTVLIRNTDGDYTPAHRSLLEFFVAYKLAAELGALLPDFTELAQRQSNIDSNSTPQGYTWSEYFQREIDQKGEIRNVSPLTRFVAEPIEKLQGTVGRSSITSTILNFISGMIDIQSLVKNEKNLLAISAPQNTQNILTILQKIILTKKLEYDAQVEVGQTLVKVLEVAGDQLQKERLNEWHEIILICLSIFERLPLGAFENNFCALFFRNTSLWWQLTWLRFLGNNRINVLENYVAENLDKWDEILKGRSFCYLGDIASRMRYNEILAFIKEQPSFLRPRALYYLWRVEPEHFYSIIHKLETPISGKILVSDDSFQIATLLKKGLERSGLSSLAESSTMATLEILNHDNEIALLITDVIKPAMNGIELIDRIRVASQNNYLPVILESGSYWNVNYIAKPTKVDLVIGKPFTLDVVLNSINLLLLYNCASLKQHLCASQPDQTVFKFLY